MPVNQSLHLEPVSYDNYQEFIRLIGELRPDLLTTYIVAYASNPKLCQAVVDDKGEIYASIFTENKGLAMMIHTVLSDKGRLRRHALIDLFTEMVEKVFVHYPKVVVSTASHQRLISWMAGRLGFQLEGTHRREADGINDMLYYGLFREDYYGR